MSATGFDDVAVVTGAFDSVVERIVVVGAVAVVLTVGLVVFCVVRHEIGRGEAVVGGHEVDRCPRPPTVAGKNVLRACES